MNRLAMLVVVASMSVAACGSKTPTAASNPNQVKFTAALSPANEVPAITNAENTGRGTANITFNLTKDAAGTITAATADFSWDATNFPPGTPINIAHIHNAPAGNNGGVVVNTGLGAGEIVLVTGTQTGITKTGIPVTGTLAQDIINNPSQYYFNMHSGTNPNGVARGQLVKQ
jgi:hypothetical protein